MLILAAAATTSPATQPAETSIAMFVIFWGLIATLSIGGLFVAVARYGILRASRVAGPDRAPWPVKIWPLWVGLGISILGLQIAVLFLASIFPLHKDASGEIVIRDSDLAIYSVVPPVITFMVVAAILVQIAPGLFTAIGLSVRTLGRGVKLGLLAALVIIPWVFVVSEAVEHFYQWTQFQHPAEHDLLRVMNTPESFLKWLAILGAILVAPICEEFVFRGLMQTAITEGLLRLLYPYRFVPAVLSDAAAPAGTTSSSLPPAIPAAPSEPPPLHFQPNPAAVPALIPIRPPHARHLAAWLAILITSVIFSLVHPLWTSPIIFFLAVWLGYVYERTGKLWVPMTVHASFNIISVALYLLQH